MKNIESRRYGYDPVYDRLDRKALIEMYKRVFFVEDPSDLQSETRSTMIDGLLDAENEAYEDTFDDPENYPLRRPDEIWGENDELSRADGQRLFWCWAENYEDAARALVTDIENHEWGLDPEIREGDLILTGIDCTPPLIVALEVARSAVDEAVAVDRLATFSNPIALREVEMEFGGSLPRASARLDDEVADRVLQILGELVRAPRPIFVSAGKCVPLDHEDIRSALTVSTLLQEGPVDGAICAACGRSEPRTVEVHFFRPNSELVLLEIQDHLDDVALLCIDCHEIAHRPSLQSLRAFAAAPGCPVCGERNPQQIVWGMPSLPLNEEDVYAGCALPLGIPPEWRCRNCETSYAVVPFRGNQEVVYTADHEPTTDG